MRENTILNKHSEEPLKVYVNDKEDFVYLDPTDTSFTAEFRKFLQWIDEKGKEVSETAQAMEEKYRDRPMIETDENGNTDIDMEQFGDLTDLQCEFNKAVADRIEALFGQNILHKYFYLSYEINPEFIPDELAIADFLDAMTPVLEDTFKTRFKRLDKRYSANRRGKRSRK